MTKLADYQKGMHQARGGGGGVEILIENGAF